MAKKSKSSMDLRTRIAIAFISVVIIPVILCSVALMLLVNHKLKAIGKEYNISNPGMESLYNNALLISREMDEKVQEIQIKLDQDPAELENMAVLNQINGDLLENGAFLAVLKDGVVYYNGSQEVSNQDLKLMLPVYIHREDEGTDKGADDGGAYLQVRDQALLKQVNFSFSDGSDGSIYLVSQLNRVAPELRNAVSETILLILVFLTITCVCMSFWIYRGVMSPINELKKAAQNIRDGNLNFTIRGSGVKEINDLCEDFEEMRVRLKESAEEKVEFDSQSKELLSNISHDLKTPATAIQGYAEGLIDGVADTPEKQERYIRTIYNKTNEITRLIDELTTYAKIDTNRIPYNFAKIRVTDYFNDCTDEMGIELEQQNIELNYFNYLTDDPVIIADPEQLRRVINNIVGNSVKYMDKPKGAINIRLRDVGDFVQIEIEDNGRGIAQKDITRIFDRFYRSDTARKAKGGSGIGLSIVKKIIEDHEGKVWATSKEGVGTVIYFVLRKYQEVKET